MYSLLNVWFSPLFLKQLKTCRQFGFGLFSAVWRTFFLFFFFFFLLSSKMKFIDLIGFGVSLRIHTNINISSAVQLRNGSVYVHQGWANCNSIAVHKTYYNTENISKINWNMNYKYYLANRLFCVIRSESLFEKQARSF